MPDYPFGTAKAKKNISSGRRVRYPNGRHRSLYKFKSPVRIVTAKTINYYFKAVLLRI